MDNTMSTFQECKSSSWSQCRLLGQTNPTASPSQRGNASHDACGGSLVQRGTRGCVLKHRETRLQDTLSVKRMTLLQSHVDNSLKGYIQMYESDMRECYP